MSDQNDYLVQQASLQEHRAKVRSLNVVFQSLIEAQMEYVICKQGPKTRQRQFVSQMGMKVGWETTCESLLVDLPRDALVEPDFAMYFPDTHEQVYQAHSAFLQHRDADRLAADYMKAMLQVGMDREGFRRGHPYSRVIIGESVVPGASRDAAPKEGAPN